MRSLTLKIFLTSIFTIFLVNWSVGQSGELLDLKKLKKEKALENIQEKKADSLEILKIDLSRQRLEEFPKELFKFPNIQYLDLSKNKLDSIPESIKLFKNLQVLILSKNELKSLPAGIYELENLKILVLNSNGISYISPNIQNLKKLEKIDLWSTNVVILPDQMTKLENIKEIDMRGISMNVKYQSDILDQFPDAKVYLDMPCNCGL